MSLEGLFGLPQVNNSNKGDGAMMKEIVKGTFDSAGVATVYTQLTKIEYHTLGYVFNGASQADAINVEQVSSGRWSTRPPQGSTRPAATASRRAVADSGCRSASRRTVSPVAITASGT